MKIILVLSILLTSGLASAQGRMTSDPMDELKSVAASVAGHQIESLPVRDRGRLKPLHTFTRETLLFLTGRYSLFGMPSMDLYFGIIVTPSSEKLELINIRNPRVRELLQFKKARRHFSFAELKKSALQDIAMPLLRKEEENSRLLEPEEKDILEVYNQYWVFDKVRSGSHFLNALIYVPPKHDDGSSTHGETDTPMLKAGQSYLRAVAESKNTAVQKAQTDLMELAKKAPVPELFKGQKEKSAIEVMYNKSKIFFIAALFLILLGILLIVDREKKWIFNKPLKYVFILPFLILTIGFALRVYITGFAPVTNMYGTMIWVSLGITLFSMALLYLYKDTFVVGCLWLTSAGFLILTDSIPLILSPDLDPIVAVLRSNLWLTTHVLTIVISYAAFSIAMVLGNIVVGRALIYGHTNDNFVKTTARSIYRMIQLGVFLLSIGIILGGIWADYSWGRFWGWDPKETWALIADIGFLAILHSRHAGWLGPFGVAVASPLAYLLVVMAWYGVNFILAAGLHSYGFSSGGTALVVSFVVVQVLFLLAFLVKSKAIKTT